MSEPEIAMRDFRVSVAAVAASMAVASIATIACGTEPIASDLYRLRTAVRPGMSKQQLDEALKANMSPNLQVVRSDDSGIQVWQHLRVGDSCGLQVTLEHGKVVH